MSTPNGWRRSVSTKRAVFGGCCGVEPLLHRDLAVSTDRRLPWLQVDYLQVALVVTPIMPVFLRHAHENRTDVTAQVYAVPLVR